MSQSQLLRKVIAVLEATGTHYMLTGSYASSLQGEPRLTHDIDLVVAMTPAAAQGLVAAFPAPNYYLDPAAIDQAMANDGQFNLLDITGGDKTDFWLLTDEPFDQSRFQRRYAEQFEGQQLYVSSPEDTILMKLHWAVLSGGSEKQFGDARSIYELQHPNLDMAYLNRWAQALQATELWQRLQREAQH